MSIDRYPPVDYIKESLREENGHLFWLNRPRGHFSTDQIWKIWNKRWSLKEAGSSNRCGNAKHYAWIVGINNTRILRHLLVWAIHNNEWINGIDHKNRIPLDDRIENLRIASQSQNCMNRGMMSSNTSGYKGVSFHKSTGKWQAEISYKGNGIYLGLFDNIEDARIAYINASEKYFGEYAYFV